MRGGSGLLALALLIGLLWGVFLSWLGIHVTGDSVAYLNNALAVAQSGQLDSNPIWPPLYPMLLGALTRVVGLPTLAAAILSGASLALLLAATGRIVLWATQSVAVAAVSMVFLCGWWEVLYVFRVAWSEQLFAALVALHLLTVIVHHTRGQWWTLGLAALSVAMVSLCRYIGHSLTLIFCLYAAIWVVKHRAWRAVGAVAVGLAPLALWLVRNVSRSGTLHGERSPTDRGLGENLSLAASVIVEQLWQTPLLPSLLVATVIAAGLVLWKGSGPRRWLLLYVGGWLLLYGAMLLFATSTVQMDRINPRFFSPILPALLLLCLLAFAGLAERAPVFRPGLLAAVSVLLIGGMLTGGRTWLAGMETLVHDVNIPAYSEEAGFSASSTARDLNALLAERLSARPQLGVLMLTNATSGLKARVLMMRRSVITGSGLGQPRIRDVSQRTMTIDLTLDGVPREVVVHNPLTLNAPSAVRRAFRAARETEGELLVLARVKALNRAGVEDLTRLERGCQAEPSIPPYLVFSCTSASARR